MIVLPLRDRQLEVMRNLGSTMGLKVFYKRFRPRLVAAEKVLGVLEKIRVRDRLGGFPHLVHDGAFAADIERRHLVGLHNAQNDVFEGL